MKQPLSTALTLSICVFLLVEGIWGLFSPVVFGVLTTNHAHAIIHLVLGAAGLLAVWKRATKAYFGFLGSLLIVVAFLWLLPATREVPRGLLNINAAVTAVNFVVGILCLVIAFTETSRRRFGVPGTTTNPPMRVAGKSRKAA